MSDNDKLVIEAILASIGLESIKGPGSKISCKQQ